MTERYTFYPGEKDKKFHIAEMKKYVHEKQEMDKLLEKMITPFIKDRELKILDACCGIGHVAGFLAEISPRSHFTGIDQTSWLIEEARGLYKGVPNLAFEAGDAYDLPKKHSKEFDITINWKTLSWLPYYEELLKSLFAVTRKHLFISSLFYDGDIDFEVKVREYQAESGRDGFNAFYNVYSYPRFKKFAESLGAKKIEAVDFEIGIDLPKGPMDLMGTYTEKLANGKRLQLSGAVVMFWKIIRIDL